MNILFWNLNKKDLTNAINDINDQFDFDVLIFCEFDIDIPTFLRSINAVYSNIKYVPSIGCEKIKIFTKFDLKYFTLISESKRWSIQRISHPFYSNFILATSHLPSKNHWSEESQLIEATVFRSSINNAQNDSMLNRTIIVGDLNMNPFESGMISTRAFHATSDLKIAKSGGRTVQGNYYKYFYNPMWNFFGDKSIGNSPGTCLFNSSEHTSLDWNIFDQILLSPEISDFVPIPEIDIITKIGNDNLIRSNNKLNPNYSDHLPIRFKLITDKFALI